MSMSFLDLGKRSFAYGSKNWLFLEVILNQILTVSFQLQENENLFT